MFVLWVNGPTTARLPSFPGILKKSCIFCKYWPWNHAIVNAESTKLDAEKVGRPPKKGFCDGQTMIPLATSGNINQRGARPVQEGMHGGHASPTHQTVQESDSRNCLIMSWLCNYSSLFWQRARLSFLWHNYLKLSPLVYRHVYEVGYQLCNVQNLIEAVGRAATGTAGPRITACVRKCFDMCTFDYICGHSVIGERR